MSEAWQMLGMRGPALPGQPAIGGGAYTLTESLLVPRRIVGYEAIGSLFEYRVEAGMRASIASVPFDVDARNRIDLDRIAGSEIGLTIDLERVGIAQGNGRITAASSGAGTRHINGIVSKAGVLGADSNEIVYEFVVRPSFWLATLKSDSRAFSGSIIDMLHDVISPYGLIEWRIDTRINPQRDYIRQAWETDWNFFMRVCEEWGFVVWFEHDEKTHTLVIADNASACRKHERAYGTLRYHTGGGHIDQAHIDELIVCSTLTSGKVTVNDHSYRSPRLSPLATPLRETCDQPRNTHNAGQEIYARADFAQPDTRRDAPYDESQWRDEAHHLARVKLEALRGCGLRAEARGALRGVEAGKTLSVTHYPHASGNGEYLVIRSDLDIRATGPLSSTQREYEIKASFVMQPVSEPYRMPQMTVRPVLGDEYAVIVGPENAEIFLDELNRVLVQFDWDRDGKFDGKSCIWVRLATSWQGDGMGVVTHARCGQQVLVGYVHGDPDRPVVISFVVDENNRPPWKLPANQSLTGIVSKSLGRGTQTNHLALDDTQGRMQAQLASDHGSSSVSLGYITRIAGNDGRQDARGEGFELRTDRHGAIRAAQGLLVSTWGRRGGAGEVKEIGETIGQLTAARDVHEGAAQQAQRYGAQDRHGDQSDVTRAMKNANVRLKGASAKDAHDFPEFEAPDIAVSSAANVHVAAKGCVHLASETHTAFTTGGHLSIASGKSLFASVREKIALFAQKAVTLITPGPVRIQSVDGPMVLSAQDDLSISSMRGIVRIAGRDGVDIACGGTLLRIRPDGITAYTDGKFLVHAANHATDKPQPQPVDDPVTPDKPGKLAAHHVLVEKHDGFAISNQPYRLTLDDGQVVQGVTNELGEMGLVTSNATTFGVIELMSQSEPDDVIGLVSTAVYQDASLPPPPSDAAAMKRSVQVGGKTASTPETGATSQGTEPVFLSCDPMNFGLRSYRYIGDAKPDRSLGLSRKDVEYPVAKAYTAAVKKSLSALDWRGLRLKPRKSMADAITDAVQDPLYTALQVGAFRLPQAAMPDIVVVTQKIAPDYGFELTGREAAVFGASRWLIGIAEPPFDLLFNALDKIDTAPDEIKRKIALASFDARLKDLAATIYHESRHCQQTFWMMSLLGSYPDDYKQFQGINIAFKTSVLDSIRTLSESTPFPNDSLVRIGVHRMLIFYYWWFIVGNRETGHGYAPWEPVFADADKVQAEVAKMRGVTLEQALQMGQRMEPGYYTHYHEEDAFATEEAVMRYWDQPDHADLVNPGTCTRHYQNALEKIGVSGNG